MRLALIALTSALCIAGAALAQSTVLDASTLEWEERPGDSFARLYPRSAIDRELPGAAVVCCAINDQRRLSCETAFEWPQGYGFGDATIAVMGGYRLSQASYDRVMASPERNLPIRRMMRWTLPGRMTAETTQAMDRISAASQNMCSATVS
jgi:hypothetical protein